MSRQLVQSFGVLQTQTIRGRVAFPRVRGGKILAERGLVAGGGLFTIHLVVQQKESVPPLQLRSEDMLPFEIQDGLSVEMLL